MAENPRHLKFPQTFQHFSFFSNFLTKMIYRANLEVCRKQSKIYFFSKKNIFVSQKFYAKIRKQAHKLF
jgi:hypothetical protein